MSNELGGAGDPGKAEIPGLIGGVFYGRQGQKPTIPCTGPMLTFKGAVPVRQYRYQFGSVRLQCEVRAEPRASSDPDVAFAYFIEPMVAIWAQDEAQEIVYRAEDKVEFGPMPPKPAPPSYVGKWVKSLRKLGGAIHCNVYDQKWCGVFSKDGVTIRFDDDEMGVDISDADESGGLSFHESVKPGIDILPVVKRGEREIGKAKKLRAALRGSVVVYDDYE